jgi:DNA-binding NarL/FixJ family response regulator
LVEELPPADSDPLTIPVGLLVVGSQTGIASIVQDIVRNAPAEFYSCGYVPDAGTAQRALDVAKPNIVLIELALPDRCGLRVAAELLVLHSGLRFILVSPLTEPGIVQCACAARAQHILVPPFEFRQCLCLLRLLAYDLRNRTWPRLGRDEWQVLSRFANGLTNKEIASQLGISTARLRKIDARIRKRFDARNRTEAVTRWLRWTAA